MYRFCLMKVNWRSIFIVTSLIMALTNCLQLMLVFGVNQKWGKCVDDVAVCVCAVGRSIGTGRVRVRHVL